MKVLLAVLLFAGVSQTTTTTTTRVDDEAPVARPGVVYVPSGPCVTPECDVPVAEAVPDVIGVAPVPYGVPEARPRLLRGRLLGRLLRFRLLEPVGVLSVPEPRPRVLGVVRRVVGPRPVVEVRVLAP